jgi:hypothetical protein
MKEPFDLDALITAERESMVRSPESEAATLERLHASVAAGLGPTIDVPNLDLPGTDLAASDPSAVLTGGGAKAGAGAPSLGAGGATAGVGGGLLGSSLVKGIGASVLVAAGVGGGYLIANQPAPPPQVPTEVTAVQSVVPPPSEQVAPELVESEPPAPVEPSDAPTQPKARTKPKPNDTFEGELNQIRKAQGALAAGKNDKALQIIEEHEKDTPRGQFSEDREAVRALASCRRGDPAAKSVAKRFLARYPNSVYVEGVRATCFENER